MHRIENVSIFLDMDITVEYFSVNTNSDRLLIYLNQYFESILNSTDSAPVGYVVVNELSKYVPENSKRKFPYPIFTFHIISDIDYALHVIKQNQNLISSSKRADGYLMIIETNTNECSMEFSIYNEDFRIIRDKLLEGLSRLWTITKVSEVSRKIEEIWNNKEVKEQPELKLGDYIKTINYPKSDINISENESVKSNQLSLTNASIPNERPWDRYAINHYNDGEPVPKICEGIKKENLGDVCAQAVYNRFSVIRKSNPGLIKYHREDLRKG